MDSNSDKKSIQGKYLRPNRFKRLNEFLTHRGPENKYRFSENRDIDLTTTKLSPHHGYLKNVVNVSTPNSRIGIYALSYRIKLHRRKRNHILEELERNNYTTTFFNIEDRDKEQYHIIYWETKGQ